MILLNNNFKNGSKTYVYKDFVRVWSRKKYRKKKKKTYGEEKRAKSKRDKIRLKGKVFQLELNAIRGMRKKNEKYTLNVSIWEANTLRERHDQVKALDI